MLNKGDYIQALIEYGEDEYELRKMDISELKELYEEYSDHSDLFPNDDEYDNSHNYD